jgi:hypothetical protein
MIPGIPIAKHSIQAAEIVKNVPVSRDFQTLYGRASVPITFASLPSPSQFVSQYLANPFIGRA